MNPGIRLARPVVYVDEDDVGRARRRVNTPLGCQQERRVVVLDRACVQRRKPARQWSRWSCPHHEAENGSTLPRLPRSRRATPDSCRASHDAGGVALPQGMGAKDEGHDSTMWRVRVGATSSRCMSNEMRASCLALDASRGIIRDSKRFDVTSGGCRAGGRSSTHR